jgi:hypothetical protein
LLNGEKALTKSVVAQRARAVTHHPIAAICRLLGIARQTAYYPACAHTAGFYRRVDDATALQQIRQSRTAGRRMAIGACRRW